MTAFEVWNSASVGFDKPGLKFPQYKETECAWCLKSRLPPMVCEICRSFFCGTECFTDHAKTCGLGADFLVSLFQKGLPFYHIVWMQKDPIENPPEDPVDLLRNDRCTALELTEMLQRAVKEKNHTAATETGCNIATGAFFASLVRGMPVLKAEIVAMAYLMRRNFPLILSNSPKSGDTLEVQMAFDPSPASRHVTKGMPCSLASRALSISDALFRHTDRNYMTNSVVYVRICDESGADKFNEKIGAFKDPALDEAAAHKKLQTGKPTVSHAFIVRIINGTARIAQAYYAHYTLAKWLDSAADLCADSDRYAGLPESWAYDVVPRPKYRDLVHGWDAVRAMFDDLRRMAERRDVALYGQFTGVAPRLARLPEMTICFAVGHLGTV